MGVVISAPTVRRCAPRRIYRAIEAAIDFRARSTRTGAALAPVPLGGTSRSGRSRSGGADGWPMSHRVRPGGDAKIAAQRDRPDRDAYGRVTLVGGGGDSPH